MYGELLAGRAAGGRRDRAALARDLRARAATAVGRLPRRRGAAAGARARARRLLRRVRPAAHARRWPSARCRSARCHGLRRGPDGRPRALRPLHAVHVAVQRHRAAGDLGPARLRRRRPADRRAARRPSRSARTRCCRSPRRWRPRARPPAAGPAAVLTLDGAEDVGHPARARRRARSASAVPRAVSIGTVEQLRLVPGGEGGRAGQRLVRAQQRRAATVSGTRQQPAAPAGGAQREPDDLAVGRGRPGRRARSARRRRGASSAREHAVGDVVGPDRLRARAAAARSAAPRAAAPSRSSRGAGGRRARRRASWRASSVGRSAAATACSASAFARCTRERWCGEAPSGVDPQEVLGARRARPRAAAAGREPVDLLDRRPRLVALGAGQVDDRVFTPRSAWRHDAGSERSPIASWTRTRSAPEPPRIAHQAAHRGRRAPSGGAARRSRPVRWRLSAAARVPAAYARMRADGLRDR